jgi:tetratricopeptide (TPR) repeat protein
VLDPLSFRNRLSLGTALVEARHYREGIEALTEAKSLDPGDKFANKFANGYIGLAYNALGDFEAARAACEQADEDNKAFCLALVYRKLGRRVEAEKALAKMQNAHGEGWAEWYALVYGQWGDTARALDWLERAMRNRNPGLVWLKAGGFDPLRNEPRFQAIERELNFPN